MKNIVTASDNAEVPLDPLATCISQCISQCMDMLAWEMTRVLFLRDIQPRGSVPPQTKTTTGHAPPTTTNAREHVPPPLPSRRHSHTQGVAHKRAMQPSQPVHTTTTESRRRCATTPKAEEDTQGTPGHIASRPQGPSIVLTCAMATRPKRRPTAQHQRNGVKVCCPPTTFMGHAPPLLTPCVQGNPSCCAEARNTDRVERPGSDPPKATAKHHDDRVGDQTAPRASPHTTVHQAQRPWRCAQAHDVDRQPHVRCNPPTATTTARIVVPHGKFWNPHPMLLFPAPGHCSPWRVFVPHLVFGFPVQAVSPSNLSQIR